MAAHSHSHSHPPSHSPEDGPAHDDNGPADPYVVDWDEATPRLAVTAGADAPWYASVAATVVRPEDRVTADIGCGGAGMAAALAAAMTAGRVLAVDGDPGVLQAARERLAGAGPTGARPALAPAEIEFVLDDLGGDLSAVRAAAGAAVDLVWASASVHHAGDQQRAVDNLAGLLAPGGRLALAEGGLPLRCLPWDVGVGEPGLEIRLDAAQDRWFARMRGQLPGAVPMPYGWPDALRRAGLSEVHTATWLFEAPTPLVPADRQRVVTELGLRVERLQSTGLLADDDGQAWARLLDDGDPAWLGHRNDLQRLTARSVHIGQGPD